MMPIFVSKEIIIPGLRSNYIKLLNENSLNDSYSAFRAISHRQLYSQCKLYDDSLEPLKKQFYNRYYQIKENFKKKTNPFSKMMISCKQLADVFEAFIGALYSVYNIGICYILLDKLEVIELGKTNYPEIKKCNIDELYETYDFKTMEESILNYQFKNKQLLVSAFIHPSKYRVLNITNSSFPHYELLGESIIKLIVVLYLCKKYTYGTPGLLTNLKMGSFNIDILAEIFVRNGFHRYIIHDSLELKNDINEYENKMKENIDEITPLKFTCSKVFAVFIESLVGVLYIDHNKSIENLWRIFEPLMTPYIQQLTKFENTEPKGLLPSSHDPVLLH